MCHETIFTLARLCDLLQPDATGQIVSEEPPAGHSTPHSSRASDKFKIQAPCLSHIRREKSHHPHGTAAIQKAAASSRQAASKQQPAFAPLKELSNIYIYIYIYNISISLTNQPNTQIELFPGARPQNNEIVQLLKVVVMPNLNFSRRTASRYDF